MARLKDKKRILKVIKEKQTVIYKGEPIRLIWLLNRNISGQKEVTGNIQGDEKQGPTTKATLAIKIII